jgi:hypothetical protein
MSLLGVLRCMMYSGFTVPLKAYCLPCCLSIRQIIFPRNGRQRGKMVSVVAQEIGKPCLLICSEFLSTTRIILRR